MGTTTAPTPNTVELDSSEEQEVLATVQRVTEARDETAAGLVQRDVEAQLLTLAIVCKTNLALVGASGWAKSQTIKDFLSRIDGARIYETSMSPTTAPETVLGPLNIAKLEEGVYERVTTGKLPEAHVGLLDEGYRASDAIFDDLLPIANERIFDNNGVRPIPLWTLIMSTNHVPGPDQPEMAAFLDRMVLGKIVQPIRSEEGRRRMSRGNILRRAQASVPGAAPAATQLTLEDIELLQSIAPRVQVTDEFLTAALMVWARADEKGLDLTGRRFNALIGVCQGVALLAGRFHTLPGDLAISEHVLWKNPEDHPTAYEIALEHASLHDKRASDFADLHAGLSEELAMLRPMIEAVAPEEVMPEGVTTAAVNLNRRYSALADQIGQQTAQAADDGHDLTRLQEIGARVEAEREWVKRTALGLGG